MCCDRRPSLDWLRKESLISGSGHCHEHLARPRLGVIGGFPMICRDSPQGGDTASRTGGQRAHHEHDNKGSVPCRTGSCKSRCRTRRWRSRDIAHAQHRAGHGHGQHGLPRLDKALFDLNFLLHQHQIGDDHACSAVMGAEIRPSIEAESRKAWKPRYRENTRPNHLPVSGRTRSPMGKNAPMGTHRLRG